MTIRGSLGDYMGSEPTEEQSEAMAWMRSIEPPDAPKEET